MILINYNLKDHNKFDFIKERKTYIEIELVKSKIHFLIILISYNLFKEFE